MAAESSTSDNLTLRSSDGKFLKISKSAATQSATLKNMMEENLGDEVIPIPNIDGETLTKVVAFMHEHGKDRGLSEEEKEKFDEEFFAGANFDMLVPIVNAGNFLNVGNLLERTCQRFADMIKDEPVERVRELFKITNDFTPEEEARIRAEYAWAFEDPVAGGGDN